MKFRTTVAAVVGLLAAAVAAPRGLLADKAPVPPWEWRASERDRKAAKRQPAGR